MKKLFLIGAGGFGREVLWLVNRINAAEAALGREAAWDVVGFIDDMKASAGTLIDGLAVFETEYLKSLSEDVYAVISIGSGKARKTIAEGLKAYPNVQFATLIDPSVLMSERVRIGSGSIICAGAILTVNITIGKHVIVNLDCTVGHDAVIEDFVTLYPSVNVSGNVLVCEETELGTGTQVIQGRVIGKQSIVGAGAVVVKDIPQQCTAVGCPAKPIKFFR